MAGKHTGLQRTYIICDSNGIPMYTGVTYGSIDGEVIIPTSDNTIPVGIVTNDERVSNGWSAGGDQTGRNIAVQVSGYGAIKLGEDVDYGDKLILGAGGVAMKVGSTAGTYYVIGFAEKTGSKDEIIPVKIAIFTEIILK